MKATIKTVIYFLPIALLATACSRESATEEKTEDLKPLVVLETVELKPFQHEIKVQGNVETDQDIILSSEMGGLITDIYVKEGQRVSQGQVIARVDGSVLASNMVELQTQLKYAEYMLDKQKELNKRGVGSDFDLETAQTQVNSIKASMNSLSTQQGKTAIKAPFTGVIDQVFASAGQMAGPASPIVRLVNNNSVDIVATVSEKHLMSIHEGTELQVSFPNYSDTTITLKVTNVGNYIEPTNRTFRIMSTIKNNKLLLPNMLAEVKITDLNVESGIVIPSKAITKDQDNRDFVYIAKKEGEFYRATKQDIEVISTFEGQTLVKDNSTLKAGDLIVTEGGKGITNNDIVRNK